MHEYENKVRVAALKRDGEPLYNGSIEHAAVLSSAMFEHASKEVCIVSGKLDARVYGNDEFVKKVRIFLSTPGRKVRVVLEEPDCIDEEDHLFVKSFAGNDDVSIRKLSDHHKSIPYHFIVMDEDSYRFEEDKSVPSAVAAFGDKTGGSNLTKLFNMLWEDSVDLN